MKRRISFTLMAVVLIIIDQLSKSWIVKNLKGKENIVIIKNVFELEYLENTGAAFSSFTGKQVFLLVLTSVILLFVIIEFLRTPEEKKYNLMFFALSLLFAGAVGNMIDRVKQAYVVDFLYFVPINFPRFNVADCYITVAAILVSVLVLFVYKDEDTAYLFRFKKK